MNRPISDYLIAAAIAAMAGLGGAAVVFSEYDDAPGGVLIGFLLVAGAAGLVLRTLRRTRDSLSEPA